MHGTISNLVIKFTTSLCNAATELRLVDGENRCEGRLEIRREGIQFGQACDLNPGNSEAMVTTQKLATHTANRLLQP